MSTTEPFLLESAAPGIGRLSAHGQELVAGRACTRCGFIHAKSPIDVEVSVRRPEPILDTVIAASSSDSLQVTWGQYAVNFVIGGPRVAVVRQDFLESLTHVKPDTWRIGSLAMEGERVCDRFRTVHDLTRIEVRGSRRSTRNACFECGRFLYLPIPPFYLMARFTPLPAIRQTNQGSKFIVDDAVAALIRRDYGDLTLSSISYRQTPEDGLGEALPASWEEYEEFQRHRGLPTTFPRRPWIPGVEKSFGTWVQQRIDTHGMEFCFERPDVWKVAIIIESHLDEEQRLSALEALKYWPRSFEEDVRRLLPRARRHLELPGSQSARRGTCDT